MNGGTEIGVNIRADASGVESGAQEGKAAITGFESVVEKVAGEIQQASARMSLAIQSMGASMKMSLGNLGTAGESASAGLARVDRAGAEAAAGVKGFSSSLGGALEIAKGFVMVKVAESIGEIGAKTIETAAEFERLRSVLTTLEGSGSEARFQALKKFATDTPYQLTEVVEAFSKLKAQGLDPSNAALMSYGNTASAMGKHLDQMIEAVADAAMGEFERLKEFGIKASQQGDKITFHFKGVTTTVAKDSAEIQKYLQKIGNTDFAGAMTRQMDTLGGKFSNLEDAAAGFADAVGQGGLSAALKTAMDAMTGAIGNGQQVAETIGFALGSAINVAVASVQTLASVFSTISNTIFTAFNAVAELVRAHLVEIKEAAATLGAILAGVLAGALASATAAAAAYAAVLIGDAITGTIAFAQAAIAQAIPAVIAMVTQMRAGAIPAFIAFGRAAMVAAGQAIAAFAAFMASNPLGWIAIGVGVAVAAFAKFTNILDPLIAKLKEIGIWLAKVTGMSSTIDDLKKIWSGGAQPVVNGPLDNSMPKGSTFGSGKTKKPKDDLVQKLEEELTAKKAAWAKSQDAQGTAQEFSLQQEERYWAEALKRADLSEKNRAAIEQKWLGVRASLKREEITKRLEAYKVDLEAAGDNAAKKLEILQKEAAYISQMYGARSKEAIAASAAVVKAELDAAKQRIEIEQMISTAKAEARLADLDARQASAGFDVQMGRMTNQQLLQLERQFLTERNAIEKEQLQAKKDAIDPGKDPKAIQQINNQILAQERQFQTQMVALERKSQVDRKNLMEQSAQPFAQNIARMVTLQQGFNTTMKGIWSSMVNMFATEIQKMVVKWMVTQATKTAITTTATATRTAIEATGAATSNAISAASAMVQIAHKAAVAAASAYAAIAAIPFVGPALAPAAAAAALAGVFALGKMVFSAEGGMANVPYDNAPFLLHKNEMVLPSPLADRIRSMTAGAGGSGAAPALTPPAASNDAAPTGDTHIHFHSMFPPSPAKARQWAKQNSGIFGAGVKQYARDGGR